MFTNTDSDKFLYKLVVISDIHHDLHRLERLVPVINAADYLIFCGDGVDDIMRERGRFTVPILCVRGNNDIGSNITELVTTVFGNTRALVTHGHRQGVRQGMANLMLLAQQKNCHLVFFGHTHAYFDMVANGIHFINPGALCNGTYALVAGDGSNFMCKMGVV